MTASDLFELFSRRRAESDPDFRSEIDRLAQRGLRLIGWIEIGMTCVNTILWGAGIMPFPREAGPTAWSIASFLALGVVALLASRRASLLPYSRPMAIALGILTAFLMSTVDIAALRLHPYVGASLDLLTVLLVAVAVLPLTPLQVVVVGGAAIGYNAGATRLAVSWGWIANHDPMLTPILVLAALCVFLSGINYGRIHATWLAHRDAMQAAETLRTSELRTCFAENASTTLRLAAALSHEFNTPLGALKSSVDTITRIADRLPSLSGNQQSAAISTLTQLTGVAGQATERLQQVVRRMQRFSNLDKAEVREIDLRQLIEDVILLHAPADERKTRIDVNVQNLPKFEAAPQALSGVLPALLNREIAAAGPEGWVRIGASMDQLRLRVMLEHSGAPDESLDTTAFEPVFQVQDGRVGTSNWDLFSARQLILTHGGDISVDPSAKNRITVELPVVLTNVRQNAPFAGFSR